MTAVSMVASCAVMMAEVMSRASSFGSNSGKAIVAANAKASVGITSTRKTSGRNSSRVSQRAGACRASRALRPVNSRRAAQAAANAVASTPNRSKTTSIQ